VGYYEKLPIVVEAITFTELVQHGKLQNKDLAIHELPWSFDYKGYPITHERDDCYIIPTLEGSVFFTPSDMLLTGIEGEIYPCKIDIFNKTYKKI